MVDISCTFMFQVTLSKIEFIVGTYMPGLWVTFMFLFLYMYFNLFKNNSVILLENKLTINRINVL